jgi:hypothetical protein
MLNRVRKVAGQQQEIGDAESDKFAQQPCEKRTITAG